MNPTHPDSQTSASRSRYFILLLLFVCVVINYLDRNNLAIVMPALSAEYGFTPLQQGMILSAFGWTYAALQIPGGWLVDRVSPRILYACALILWSLATLLLGFASSFLALILLRLCVGAFEAPAFPINNRVVTTWFPETERAGAISLYTSGQFVGLAFLSPLLFWLQHTYNWQTVFIFTGLVGMGWGLLWYLLYREPRQFRFTNPAELALIKQGGGTPDLGQLSEADKPPFNWRDLGQLLSHRKLWGAYLGQFCLTSTLWFFLTWFPSYLVQYRGMDYIKSGWLASLPFLAAFCGVLCSGLLSDWLKRRGASLGLARKLPIVSGMLISISIIGANYTDSIDWVIFFMALAFFGNGVASITWSLVSSLAPARLLGLTGGVFNFFGNLAAIATPFLIGKLIEPQNFGPALTYISALALLGACSYIFLVGKVERIEL